MKKVILKYFDIEKMENELRDVIHSYTFKAFSVDDKKAIRKYVTYHNYTEYFCAIPISLSQFAISIMDECMEITDAYLITLEKHNSGMKPFTYVNATKYDISKSNNTCYIFKFKYVDKSVNFFYNSNNSVINFLNELIKEKGNSNKKDEAEKISKIIDFNITDKILDVFTPNSNNEYNMIYPLFYYENELKEKVFSGIDRRLYYNDAFIKAYNEGDDTFYIVKMDRNTYKITNIYKVKTTGYAGPFDNTCITAAPFDAYSLYYRDVNFAISWYNITDNACFVYKYNNGNYKLNEKLEILRFLQFTIRLNDKDGYIRNKVNHIIKSKSKLALLPLYDKIPDEETLNDKLIAISVVYFVMIIIGCIFAK